MEYPKINTLWKREEGATNKGKVIEGNYALEEFKNIKQWEVQEKIDGTNIRIHYYLKLQGDRTHYYDEYPTIEFFGRSNEASIPRHLEDYLKSYFTHELLSKSFDLKTNEDIWLFGEGYGPKIQKGGGNYGKEVSFTLFDIKVGKWWLTRETVQTIASQLGVSFPPIIGVMTEEQIVEYVKSRPYSLCSLNPQIMEGVIARTPDLLLLRSGERLMFKLKCKDFDK